jgi:hypothetical protein
MIWRLFKRNWKTRLSSLKLGHWSKIALLPLSISWIGKKWKLSFQSRHQRPETSRPATARPEGSGSKSQPTNPSFTVLSPHLLRSNLNPKPPKPTSEAWSMSNLSRTKQETNRSKESWRFEITINLILDNRSLSKKRKSYLLSMTSSTHNLTNGLVKNPWHSERKNKVPRRRRRM